MNRFVSSVTCGFLMMAGSAAGQIAVDEQFDGTEVDTSVFTFSGPGDESIFGRTQLNSPGLPGAFDAPPVVDGSLRLRLQTFNPFGSAAGNLFLADEIRTIRQFAPTENFSFSFETRARFVDDDVNPLAPGLVGGAFLFGVDANFPNPAERDEIDFELLSNFPQNTITTNIFNDQGFTSGGDFVVQSLPGLNITEFNDYRIVSSIESTQFFVNDALIREEFNNLAIEPQDFRLNINAPAVFFNAAFSDLLQPTDDPSQNETFIFEVDSLFINQSPTINARGDLNVDGFIDLADAELFVEAFDDFDSYVQAIGLTLADALTLTDINLDGVFTLADVEPFAVLLGDNPAALEVLTAIPEPSAAALLLALGGVVWRRPRTRRGSSNVA